MQCLSYADLVSRGENEGVRKSRYVSLQELEKPKILTTGIDLCRGQRIDIRRIDVVDSTCNNDDLVFPPGSVEANIVPRKIQTEIAVGSFQELEQTQNAKYVDFPYKSSVILLSMRESRAVAVDIGINSALLNPPSRII
jgi:hypothetical protein